MHARRTVHTLHAFSHRCASTASCHEHHAPSRAIASAEWLCSNAKRFGSTAAQSANSSRRRTATGLVVVCLVVIVGSRSAVADELELSNGDRITGQVMSLISGMLAFQTPNGQLNVPWTNVTGLAVPEPVFVTVWDSATSPVTIARTRTDGRVTLRPGGIVSLTEIRRWREPASPRS